MYGFYLFNVSFICATPLPEGVSRVEKTPGVSALEALVLWKGSTTREPRGMEMGPRAFSAWRGVRRLCGMYTFTTNPSFGWEVNKTEVPCWSIATLFAR